MCHYGHKSIPDAKFESGSSSVVPQLSKCLKFEAIRGDRTDQRIGI